MAVVTYTKDQVVARVAKLYGVREEEVKAQGYDLPQLAELAGIDIGSIQAASPSLPPAKTAPSLPAAKTETPKRGRPAGSKNRPKPVEQRQAEADAHPDDFADLTEAEAEKLADDLGYPAKWIFKLGNTDVSVPRVLHYSKKQNRWSIGYKRESYFGKGGVDGILRIDGLPANKKGVRLNGIELWNGWLDELAS